MSQRQLFQLRHYINRKYSFDNLIFLFFIHIYIFTYFFLSSLFSPTAPHPFFKEDSISAAKQKKAYANPPPSNINTPEETGTPPPQNSVDHHPSPYKKSITKRQAFTVDKDVRILPAHKPKSQNVKDNPSNSSNSTSNFLPEPVTPFPIPAPFHNSPQKAIKKLILNQPISSLGFPKVYSQSYAPPLHHTVILDQPMNAQTLSIFMASHLDSDRNRPPYDAAAAEITLGFIIYLITQFFHERPHSCQTEVEGRVALLTEIKCVMRTLSSIK